MVSAIVAQPCLASDWQKRLAALEEGRGFYSGSDLGPRVQIAQTTQAEPQSFSISAGSLQDALLAFSQQVDLQLLYPANLTAGLETQGVQGSVEPEQALRALLAGTGLNYRFTDANTVTLEQATVQEDQSLQLAPITVTGERVERSVFETSSSVAVVRGEDIERTPSIDNVGDILERIPNITSSGQQNQAPAIRGVDTTGPLSSEDAFAGGALPRATVTVDGRPVSFNEYVFGATSAFDLERVEVFRGPQTTAQGENSIAGAIYVVTKDPTFEPEFNALAEGGSFGQRQAAVAVSGPLIEDELAARITIDYQRKQSFVDYPTTVDFGEDPEDFEASVVRSKLLWEPEAIPELSTKLTLSRSESQAPQGEFVRQPFSDLEALNPNQSVIKTEAVNGIHDISYSLNDSFELSNQFSIADIEFERLAPPGQGVAEIDSLDLVNETTLAYANDDGSLSGLVGSYFRRTDSDEFIDLTAFLGTGDFEDEKTSVGLFGETTVGLTERFDVTLGLRYQWNKQDRSGDLGPATLDFDETFDAFLPKISIGYDVTDELRIGALVSRGFNPGGTTINFGTGASDTFDEETVWNYEAFARAQFFENRLGVNANIFFADYRDFQSFSFIGFDVFGDPEFEIDNVDKVRSYGTEVSADFLASKQLRFFGGLGLLNTEIVDFSSSSDPNVEGNQLAFAPNVTFSAGVDYEVIKDLTLGARVRYSDSYFTDDSNDFESDAYVVTDLQVSYRLENLEAFAFVNNVFDEFYVLNNFGTGATVGAPRVFGAGMKVSF